MAGRHQSEAVSDPPEDRVSGPPQRGRDNLAVLAAVAAALNSAASVEEALQQTLRLLTARMGLLAGWVWLLDSGTQQFYRAAAVNLPPELRDPVRMTGNPCDCIEAFRMGKLSARNVDILRCSRLCDGALGRSREAGGAPEAGGARSHASIPLLFQGRPLGILNLVAPAWRKLTSRELELLAALGSQVSTAVERARLAEEATRLARMEERTRVAREIHDTLAQGLTAITLHLESALLHQDSRPDRTRVAIETALQAARDSLEDARQSVLDLRAAALEGKPLAEALVALGRSFTAETGIPVQASAVSDRALPPHIELELYRIAQEALTNVRRHAEATQVAIRLRTVGDRTRLSIQDDGRGFQPEAAGPGHFGIIGMRERARLLGGSLRIVSGLGRGTAVAVVLPLSAEGRAAPPESCATSEESRASSEEPFG